MRNPFGKKFDGKDFVCPNINLIKNPDIWESNGRIVINTYYQDDFVDVMIWQKDSNFVHKIHISKDERGKILTTVAEEIIDD